MKVKRHASTVGGILAAVVLSGCQQLPKPALPAKDVAEHRVERREQVVADFERRRDEAALRAAETRWKTGDLAGCEQMLRSLLERSPELFPAQKRLADVLLAMERNEEAEVWLRNYLRANPHDAEAHHNLGMLLETTGRQGTAQHHFRRAVELAPDVPLYQMTVAN